MKRINDKIKEIEKFLEQLKSITPPNLEEYKASIEKKAACERYVEKIVEAVTDLAFLKIKQKKLEIPEDDFDSFSILSDKGIIDKNLANKLKDAKGMRNIIAHQYNKVNDKLVYNSITGELENDVASFISKIKNDT